LVQILFWRMGSCQNEGSFSDSQERFRELLTLFVSLGAALICVIAYYVTKGRHQDYQRVSTSSLVDETTRQEFMVSNEEDEDALELSLQEPE